MRPGARLQAAIEVLEEMERRHRPAAQTLADWGRAHRFAGSGDRAAIGNLVFDALRRRASIAQRMGSDGARAAVLGVAGLVWETPMHVLESWCDGSRHVPEPLSDAERSGLETPLGDDVPVWVRGDYPEWLAASLERAFGARAAEEGVALARRAPIDLRVNTLKAGRDKVQKALARFEAAPTPLSPVGLRVPPPVAAAKSPHLEAEAAHGKGWFEVQDEGSQLAALLTGAVPGQQVADLCAGAGGKTLALAAQMENSGQVYAYDDDKLRLRPIFERLKRAGVRNAQVLPAGEGAARDALAGKMDVVLVDAPCTGSGAWRRHPDAKWRLKPQALEARLGEQRIALGQGASLVNPGGRLAYVTCSILPEENGDQVRAFLERHPDFAPVPYGDVWRAALPGDPPASADGHTDSLLLTPREHGTDGFFVAVLERTSGPVPD